MNIILKNHELVPCIEFLQSMELPANNSRPVVKLTQLLSEALSEVQDSQMTLIDQYGERNEAGELILTADQSDYFIHPPKRADYEAQATALLNEEVVITGGPFVKVIERLPEVFANYDVKISGKEALIYDRLLDEFEKGNDGEASSTI